MMLPAAKPKAIFLIILVVILLFIGGIVLYRLSAQKALDKSTSSGFKNPFDRASTEDKFQNPFAEPTPTVYQNPFGESAENQEYRNPFKNLR